MAELVIVTRIVMAAIWIYNGLWLKVIAHDPGHLAIVSSVLGTEHASVTLIAIGAGETVLALGILSGIAVRIVNTAQIALLVAMNTIGIIWGGVDKPMALVLQNLPLVCCAMLVIIHARRG